MTKNFFKKSVVLLMSLLILLNPFLVIAQATPAKAEDITPETTDITPLLVDIKDQSTYEYKSKDAPTTNAQKMPIDSSAFKGLLALMAQYSGQNSFLTFDDLFVSTQEPKIIMKQNDLAAIKSTYCLSSIMPKFDEDFTALYDNFPNDQKKAVDKDKVKNPQFKTISAYLSFLKTGTDGQAASETITNSNKFNDLVISAKKNFGDEKVKKAWQEEEASLRKNLAPSVDLDTMVCITGIGRERIVDYINHDKATLADRLQESIDALNIDVRVLKTLVYLITPKNQDGAGHWRIRVQRILQNNSKSTESDAILQSIGQKAVSSAECTEDMTAAECGEQQGTTADLTIEDKDGTQYDAYLQSLTTAEDKTIEERGLSAHAEGQAIDISEIDDIRCTKVIKKNTGGTKKYKQPIQPIKLAWQTTDGWNASGGQNNFDMMNLLKSAASESVSGLLSSLNSDITDYEGDLSKANFDDIVGVLGQSLLSNILGSKSMNFEGANVEDTLKKLGSTYVADYLGVPREIFIGQNITDLSRVKYIIGRSAIEKKLGLPFGSLEGSDLSSTLLMVGERKIEYEMGLNSGDLQKLFTQKDEVFADFVGARAIEKELNLQKGSWPSEAVSFSDLKKSINPIRAELIKSNPGMIDNELNLGAGNTDNFINGRTNSNNFAMAVGQKRLDDTLYGLKYFSVNNSAYQLPGPTKENPNQKDTWGSAVNGDIDSLKTIGIYTLARLLADDNLAPVTDTEYDKIRVTENGQSVDIAKEEFGRYVFREWLRSNLTKSGDECSVAKLNTTIDYNITSEGEIVLKGSSKVSNSLPTSPIVQAVNYSLLTSDEQVSVQSGQFVLSEDNAMTAGLAKLDLQRIFGCGTANGKAVFGRFGGQLLYSGIINNVLSKDEGARASLLDSNPELRITNNAVTFYVSRYNRLKELTTEIKSNWSTFVKDKPDLDSTGAEINQLIDQLNGVFDASDTDLQKTQKTWQSLSLATSKIDSLLSKFETIKDFYDAKNALNIKIENLNTILANSNEMVRISSEIISGREIITSDTIKLSQINSVALTGEADSGNSTSDKSLTPFKASSLVFGFLAGNVSPSELFTRFGANLAESKLGLPTNTLTYLIENYEQKGMSGSTAFLQAIGQAKIEEVFGMPAGYFQPKTTLPSMPNFEEDAISLFQFADRSKIDELTSQYLLEKATALGSTLGTLPANISGVNSDNDKSDLLAKMLAEQWAGCASLVASAKTNWQVKQNEKIAQLGNSVGSNFNLESIVQNIAEKHLNSALNSSEKDLLSKLGLSGSLTSLKSNGGALLNKIDGGASAIDTKLDLDSGATKNLLTNNTGLYSIGLSSDEKNLLENNLKIGKNALDIYVKLANGEIKLSDLKQYNSDLQSADYVFANPYADAGATTGQCPIGFTTKDGFSINESTLENNSFCYYDQDGRHCFRSPEEEQRYASLHKDRQYGDTLAEIAARLAGNQVGATATLKNNLENYISNKNAKYAFAGDQVANDKIIKNIADSTGVSTTILNKLFSRNNSIKFSVLNYDLKVGRAVAEKVLTSKIFSSLGLNIDPDLFGPEDIYNVLNGDMSSLYRVGTSFIDKELNLKPGTVLSVYNAKDQIARDCNLSQIGGSILGSLVGLDYFPLKGNSISDFVQNFGESKIEQTLNLPRGSFFGSTFPEVIDRARAINVAIAFKLPLDDIIDDQSFAEIVGNSYASRLKNTDAENKAVQLQSYLRSSVTMNSSALNAMKNIDQKIKNRLTEMLGQIAKAPTGLTIESTSFYQNLLSLDKQFSLATGTTYNLLSGKNGVTPDLYNRQVGTALGTALVATKIGEKLGLDQNQSDLALGLVTNINNIFKCQGTLVNVGSDKVCRKGTGTDEWYHQWGKLYDSLSQVFTLELDQKAGLPEGTLQRIFDNPSDAGSVLLEVGAQKIDGQFGLDSSKIASFSGLYNHLSSASNTKDCVTEASSDPAISPLDIAAQTTKSTVSDLRTKEPAGAKDSATHKQWQSDLSTALLAQEQATKTLTKTINDNYNTCKIASSNDPSGDADGSFKPNLVTWAKDAVGEQVHDYLYNLKAKSNGDDIRIGVDMPTGDIAQLLQGDMRYFQIATLSLGVNFVMAPIDNIRKNNCTSSEDNECRTAVPNNMMVSYDDIKMSLLGPSDAETYARAAWVDANGIYSDPETKKVCDGANCPKTGSGSFGNLLIDSLGKTDSASTDSVILGRVNEDYGYSPEAIPSKIAELQATVAQNSQVAPSECGKSTGGTSGEKYDQCLANYNLNNGDPEGKIARLTNPQDYYDPSGTNFTPKNSDTTQTIRKSVKKAAQENLQYKIMDALLWKLDENIYPGMARDLLKGNAEVKAAALARYLKTGLSNGQLFGIKFTAISNVTQWAQVAIFARDLLAGNSNAFTKFAGGSGFNFFSDFLSKNSQKWLGFEMSPDLAKGLLVGIGTGDWGLNSISLDNIAKNNATTHTVTSNGQQINLPTVGGVLTTAITEKFFSWADKTLGLPIGQTFEIFKMGYDVYKTWKIYDELSKVKNIANLSENAKQFLSAKKITDLTQGQQAAQEALAAAESVLVYKIVSIAVEKLLGKQISSVEESLGMVPGTLTPLVTVAVYNLVVAPLLGLGPVGWSAAIITAVAGWLLGSKTYYYCTADGYYPQMEEPPSTSRDVTGMGVWGGRVTQSNDISKLMQTKAVQASQNKARTLIENMLWMQQYDKYKSSDDEPVVPIQIMTARQEDVDYFDSSGSITQNMCQARLGEDSFSCGGICGSADNNGCSADTRMGIWQNPQTIAWTHIGF